MAPEQMAAAASSLFSAFQRKRMRPTIGKHEQEQRRLGGAQKNLNMLARAGRTMTDARKETAAVGRKKQRKFIGKIGSNQDPAGRCQTKSYPLFPSSRVRTRNAPKPHWDAFRPPRTVCRHTPQPLFSSSMRRQNVNDRAPAAATHKNMFFYTHL